MKERRVVTLEKEDIAMMKSGGVISIGDMIELVMNPTIYYKKKDSDERIENVSESNGSQKITVPNKILNVLIAGKLPLKSSEIAKAIGLKATDINSRLTFLISKGLIKKTAPYHAQGRTCHRYVISKWPQNIKESTNGKK